MFKGSMTEDYFHTIKSILNHESQYYNNLVDINFHTIKSILN